jgi:low temperature requirement protein LtrA
MAEVTAAPDEAVRPASTLELFFDLVYVFAITQVARLIHTQPTFSGLARGALLLFLMWWTWSLYTWTTNWTGTGSLPIRLYLIAAMGATLMMSLAVPTAFDDGSAWFGITYFLVRALAAVVYWNGSRSHQMQREALIQFLPLSLAGAGLVLVGGVVGGPWVIPLWIGAVLVDGLSVASAGRGTWTVDAHHFAERNGLFVIIALGETIVAIGLSASDAPKDLIHIAALVVAFTGAATLWWSYFDRAAPFAERYFLAATGQERGRFARDAYTLLHFPLVVGIVLFAVAAEEIVLHPGDPLPREWRVSLALGASLVMLSVVAGTYRAVRRIPTERLVTAVVLIVMVWAPSEVSAIWYATLVTVALILALVIERFGRWPELIAGAKAAG